MTLEEKISKIDNIVNKSIVSRAIVSEILTKHNLVGFNKKLDDWLFSRIMQNSLYDILNNEQGMYVISLARKIYRDTLRMLDNGSTTKLECYAPQLRVFLTDVLNEYHLNFAEEVKRAREDIINNTEEDDDILILDDKMFVYVNDTKEQVYHEVVLTIGYHPNYTKSGLVERIVKRLHYDREKKSFDIKNITIDQLANKSYRVFIALTDEIDTESEFINNIEYRLGATSGKPWYRCKIEDIN